MFHHPGQRYVDAKQIVAQEGMVFLPLIIHEQGLQHIVNNVL